MERQSQIHRGQQLSASFCTRSGVRQDCILAPALFCRAIDWILDHVLPQAGISLSSESLADMHYADDIAAVDDDQQCLAQILEHIEASCSNLGFHWAKTKVQNIGAGDPMPEIIVKGRTVEDVGHCLFR